MPLMQPLQQNAWVNPSSQFSQAAQGYGTIMNYNPYYTGVQFAPSTQQQQQNAGFMSPLQNMSTIKNIGQFVGNGFNLPQSTMLNNFGSSIGFGSQSGAPLAGGVGPTNIFNTSGGLTSTSLSSTLGAAGIGALAGGFLGKIGGNSTGGSIGGGVGAAIGNAIAPGIGGVIGGALGGIVGGFFGGKKKPHPAGNIYNVGFDNTGQFQGEGIFEGKHTSAQAIRPIQNDLQNYISKQASLYNITTFNPNLVFSFGYDVSGGNFGDKTNTSYINIYSKTDPNIGKDIQFNPNDKNSVENAHRQAFEFAAAQSGIDVSKLKPVNTNNVSGAGGIMIKQGTQSSFDEFMKVYRGGNNATTTTQ